MSLVAAIGSKGAPGVTTTAVAVAAVWPRPAVLAECDPAGGDLPYFLSGVHGQPLSPSRGVVSLATGVRGGRPALAEHVQEVEGGLHVLVGGASRAQMSALSSSWPAIVDVLATADGGDVVADCGRFDADAATVTVLRRAQLSFVVCRAGVGSVAHTRDVLRVVADVRRDDGSALTPGVVVVGEPGDAAEVADALPADQVAFVVPVADDPSAAAAFRGTWSRRLDRSRLVQSARELARALDARLPRTAAPSTVDAGVVSGAVSGR